jgi:truncated hemoglobin YjbI
MNLLYQRIDGREGISNLLRHFYADVRQFGGTGYYFMTFSQCNHMHESSHRQQRVGSHFC